MLRAVLPIFVAFPIFLHGGEHRGRRRRQSREKFSGLERSSIRGARGTEGGTAAEAAVLSTHPSQPVEFRFRGSPACPPGRSGPSPPHGLASGFFPRPPSPAVRPHGRPAGRADYFSLCLTGSPFGCVAVEARRPTISPSL